MRQYFTKILSLNVNNILKTITFTIDLKKIEKQKKILEWNSKNN